MALILLIPRVISLSAALPAISRLLTSTGPCLLRSLIPNRANVRPFSSIPLPPGYTFYRNHNDNNPPPPNMTPRPDQIYVSHIHHPNYPGLLFSNSSSPSQNNTTTSLPPRPTHRERRKLSLMDLPVIQSQGNKSRSKRLRWPAASRSSA